MIEASWIRGGTSKGLFFQEEKFPYPRSSIHRDEAIKKALGFGGNGMQLDGMGGGISSTSKVAFIGKNLVPSGFDLTYDFGQVNNVTGKTDWMGSCGNLASAILLFAHSQGLISPTRTSIQVWQVNVQQGIRVTHLNDTMLNIPVVSPLDSPAIKVEFASHAQELLPTGNTVDDINGTLCTLIQGSNPTVFLPFHDNNAALCMSDPVAMEEFRQACAVRMGLLTATDALRIAFVRGARQNEACDVFATISVPPGSSRVFHHAITGTGAANLALAACIPNTVVHQVLPSSFHLQANPSRLLQIGHPSGIMEIGATVSRTANGNYISKGVHFLRTARILFKGMCNCL